MQKAKILAIAPYPGLKSLMEEQAKKYSELDVTVFVGDLDEGAEVARKHQNAFDIIISRGGTVYKIEEVCRIPAIDIPVTGGDVLAAICLAREYNGSCAIIAFPNITDSISLICDLVDFKADIYTINSTREADACLKKIQSQKYSIIVGDNIVYSLAKQQGLNSILITSGIDSITIAFHEAVMLHRAALAEHRSNQLMRSLLGQLESYVRVLDADGRMAVSIDPMGWEPLPDKVSASLKALPGNARDEPRSFTVTSGAFDYHVSARAVACAPECEPAAAFLISKPAYIPSWVVSVDSLGEFDYPFRINLLDSKCLNSFLTRASQCGQESSQALITGYHGSKLDAAAYLIHRGSPNSRQPMLLIESARLNQQKLDWLFADEKSPLRETPRTICFSSLHLLEGSLLDSLLRQVQQASFLKQSKLLFSCVQTDIMTSDSQEDPVKKIQKAISGPNLFLPGIHDYIEDIPHIVHMLINDLNIKYGTLVTGLHPQAVRLLQEYAWEGDMDQLISVMEELVRAASSNLISLDSVHEILRLQSTVKRAKHNRINLNQSLDDIVVDIIRAVMEEENQNQSKAAKRLGISRATLWRRLKTGSQQEG